MDYRSIWDTAAPKNAFPALVSITGVKSTYRECALFIRPTSEGKAQTYVKRCYRQLTVIENPRRAARSAAQGRLELVLPFWASPFAIESMHFG
jgi:hypothetical protein